MLFYSKVDLTYQEYCKIGQVAVFTNDSAILKTVKHGAVHSPTSGGVLCRIIPVSTYWGSIILKHNGDITCRYF